MGPRAQADEWVNKATQVLELGDRVITPGFVDVHTFFTGWALLSLGADFSNVKTDVQGVAALKSMRRRPLRAQLCSATTGSRILLR